MILEGTTSSGAVVPVQVTTDGKVVALGETGPEGPAGPQGPEGPPGPGGSNWVQDGIDLHPATDAAEVNLDAPLKFANALYHYASIDGSSDGSGSAGRLGFFTTPNGSTAPVERVRIANDGTVRTFGDSNGLLASSNAAASDSVIVLQVRHSATNVLGTGGTVSFRVASNGDVQNTNNSYGAISDIKLKENIVDAKSQWDDIKGLRLVNYNFKAETGNQTHKQLGLIAQEVEKFCPGLVGEIEETDADGKRTGEITKSVAYSVVYMKAVGALQEAMKRIEALENKLSSYK